jgi:hypothetical protein
VAFLAPDDADNSIFFSMRYGDDREETLYIQLFAFFQVVGYFCQAALEAQSLMINVLP